MTTPRNRADVARVATILRAKAAAMLAGRGTPLTPGEMLEMANALDPDRAVTLGTLRAGRKAVAPC